MDSVENFASDTHDFSSTVLIKQHARSDLLSSAKQTY